jgi:hypothetical protein
MYNHTHSIETSNFVPLQWSKLWCHGKKPLLLLWEEESLSVVLKPRGLQYIPCVSSDGCFSVQSRLRVASVCRVDWDSTVTMLLSSDGCFSVQSRLRFHSHTIMRQPLFDCVHIRNPGCMCLYRDRRRGTEIEQTSIPFSKTQELLVLLNYHCTFVLRVYQQWITM